MAVKQFKQVKVTANSAIVEVTSDESLLSTYVGATLYLAESNMPWEIQSINIDSRTISLTSAWDGWHGVMTARAVISDAQQASSETIALLNDLVAQSQNVNSKYLSIQDAYAAYVEDQTSKLQALIDRGEIRYQTLASLQAAGDPATITGDPDVTNLLARIWNDGTNNGLYGWNGSAWTKSDYDTITEMQTALSDMQTVLSGLPGDVTNALTSAGFEIGAENYTAVDVTGILTPSDIVSFCFKDANGYASFMIEKFGDVIVPTLRSKTMTATSMLAESLVSSLVSAENLTVINALDLNGVKAQGLSANYQVFFSDENGNVALGIKDGKVLANMDGLATAGDYNYDFWIADENGNVILGVKDGKVHPDSNSAAELALLDLEAMSKSKAYQETITLDFAGVEWQYNVIVVTGQSLANGAEGWPHLSRTQLYGNLQIGIDSRQTSTSIDNYLPAGDLSFQPLVANTMNGSTPLTNIEIAALPPGDGTKGEHIGVGMTNLAKALYNRWAGVENDTAHIFVNVNVSQGGRNIAELSKDNPTNPDTDSVNRYNWYLEALDAINTNAGADTWGVAAISFLQGEDHYTSDNPAGDGELLTKALYYSKLEQYRLDMITDAKAKSSQTSDPVWLTYQTTGSYSRDLDENGEPGLYIGMAQLELTENYEGTFMVGPTYPYSDKGGHLDGNGYRWFSQKFAQVFDHTVTKRKRWMPVRPVKIQKTDAKTFLLTYHVPQPPLQFKAPYVGDNNEGSSLPIYTNKGFIMTDDDGGVGIESVEIVGQCLVEIKTTKTAGANPLIWYADKGTHGGNGNLCDSDTTLSLYRYEYRPEWGMYETANRAEYVDKRYPLENWGVAFCLPVDYVLQDY